MKITAIKPQVKNPDRVSVYIDGKYNFSLTQNQLIQSGLRVGKELSEAELESAKKDSEYGKAYMRALDYALRRPRSEKELRDYAWRKKWEPELADRVIAQLQAKGYQDDARFTTAWVRHRALGKPISERKLRLELRQKGIADELANQAIAGSEDFDQTEALKRMIEKKRPRYETEEKLIRHLMSQGFSYSDVQAQLKAE